VPPKPFFQGSRRVYAPGDALLTDIMSDDDPQLVCFATTSQDDALDWACRRGIRHRGDILFAYQVEMEDPQVDINMHRPGSLDPITSVMSHRGIVVGVALAVPATDCRNTWVKQFCAPCRAHP
jgi:hypothetical protein